MESDRTRVLAEITAAVVAALPRATCAGLARTGEHGHVAAAAPTHPVVRVLDDLQNALRQGPCVAAVREQSVIHITDMSTDPRWPDFSGCAAQLGVASMLSVQLFVDGDVVGTLNMYSTDPEAFTGDDETLAGVFAHQAATVLHEGAASDHPSIIEPRSVEQPAVPDQPLPSKRRAHTPRWLGLVGRRQSGMGAHRLKP